MGSIKLLITDLDGTLIGPHDEYAIYEQFRERINTLKKSGDAKWAVITGRSPGSFKTVFKPLSFIGATPDYLVARHAFIYSVVGGQLQPHIIWNARVRKRIASDRKLCRKLLKECLKAVRAQFRRTQVVILEKQRLCIRFRDASTVAPAAKLIRSIVSIHSGLHVFEYNNEVEVRSVPATKGAAASELARRLNVPETHILAIGDGLNDISMLDGSVAGMTACPANAKMHVMETVSNTNGHISSKAVLAGTVDAIDSHLDNKIQSEIPTEWRDAARKRAASGTARKPQKRSGRKLLKEIPLFLLAIAVILLTLAHHGLLGPLSAPISRPFDWLAFNLARLLIFR
jgi:HAD superfamily hydrolase (TIGR01484 family)